MYNLFVIEFNKVDAIWHELKSDEKGFMVFRNDFSWLETKNNESIKLSVRKLYIHLTD